MTISITGQVGHIGLARQTQRQSPNLNSAQYRAVKITGDSLVASNNPLIAEGEIGMGRDVSDAIPGGYSGAGAINANLRVRAAAIFLEGVLGGKNIANAMPNGGTGGGGIDQYVPQDTLSYWTIEKKVGPASPSMLVIRHQDAFINTLNIAAPAGGLATISAGVITAGETRTDASGPLVTPTYPTSVDDLLVFHGGRIRLADNATINPGAVLARDETFQSVEVVINNNTAADEYTVRPSRFLRSLTEGIRSVEANMTLVFENPDKYSKYTYGAVANTQPGYSFYLGQLEVFLGNFQLVVDTLDITTATPGVNVYSTLSTPAAPLSGTQAVEILLPKLAFTGLPVALASGRIVVTTTARALRDPNQTYILQAFVAPNSAGTNY